MNGALGHDSALQVKKILGRGQPGLMRRIWLWIVPLVQDRSHDIFISSPVCYGCPPHIFKQITLAISIVLAAYQHSAWCEDVPVESPPDVEAIPAPAVIHSQHGPNVLLPASPATASTERCRTDRDEMQVVVVILKKEENDEEQIIKWWNEMKWTVFKAMSHGPWGSALLRL